MATANAAGVSLGSAVAGAAIDARGGHAGFYVAVAGALAATLLVLATLPVIRGSLKQATLPAFSGHNRS